METVNSKKSYMVWLETLNADEARVVAGIEQRVRSEEVPKGLVGWRMFVVAVVAAYEVHTANAAFARVDAQNQMINAREAAIMEKTARFHAELDSDEVVWASADKADALMVRIAGLFTATAVIERKARYTRRKPSCGRRGWK
jgi:hypothetical protein